MAKRNRRSDNQVLTDTITMLYEKIHNKLTKIEDEKLVVEEVFAALQPLRDLEDSYRNAIVRKMDDGMGS